MAESAVCQVLSEGEWLDFARTTPEKALEWIKRNPDVRRAHDWITRDPITPLEEEEQENTTDRIAARANFMFAGARALHELGWAHDSDVCPMCKKRG